MQMRTASAISTGLHVLAIGFVIVSFSGKAMNATPVESMPVDLISDKDFSQITKGVKDAPKPNDKPKPLVEKKSRRRTRSRTSKPKVSRQAGGEGDAARSEPPPPEQPQPKPRSKPRRKRRSREAAGPDRRAKADPIAEKIKKDERSGSAKPLPRAEEAAAEAGAEIRRQQDRGAHRSA